MTKPSVLFVCVKNGGKSQMAAGLMRKVTGNCVDVYSAGTKPGTAVNALSAQSLLEVGVDITDETPRSVDPQVVRDVDVVVTLGREAHVDPVDGTRFENWDTDEPSDRGIDGIERMRLVRDDIAARVDHPKRVHCPKFLGRSIPFLLDLRVRTPRFAHSFDWRVEFAPVCPPLAQDSRPARSPAAACVASSSST
jgi:arsenate-mycothiol transferase